MKFILVAGGWGSWTSWSSCTATCGGGQRTRQRICTPGEGADCYGTIEHKGICNSISCPGKMFKSLFLVVAGTILCINI